MDATSQQMSSKTKAGIVAAVVAGLLAIAVVAVPLPYVVYRPGLTLDVLGTSQGEPIVSIATDDAGDRPTPGLTTYPDDDGQLRMVTVSVTSPDTDVRLPDLLAAWFNKKNAVVPWSSVYSEGETNDDSRAEGAAQMASSQDTATAIALREAGHTVPEVTTIASIASGAPAEGVLKPGDQVLAVNGDAIADSTAMIKEIQATQVGDSVELKIKREGKTMTVSVTPKMDAGAQRIGAGVAVGYDLPVEFEINVSPSIGGPSAGLIFSLAIYDHLTPGSLTGGGAVAGSGEIGSDGSVRPIGGIQQKIAGATRDGAELFLVPTENCGEAVEAVDAEAGNIRLVEVENMHQARISLEKWAADRDATLPTCKAVK